MAATMMRRTLCNVAKVFDSFPHLSSISARSCSSSSIGNASGIFGRCVRTRSAFCTGSTHTQVSHTRVSQQLGSMLPAASSQSHPLHIQTYQSRPIHTSCLRRGLEEFFDDPKTYGEREVKSGRSWSVEELRQKDNATLHKLWYVLLKEKNMLMTMEEAAEVEDKLMPSPDRLEKVEESMENLQQVVRERNQALTELRTGHREEHPGKMVYTPFGYLRHIKPREHYVPIYANKKYHKKRYRYKPFVYKYMRLWMEQEQRKRSQEHRRRENQTKKLKKRFPDADVWQEN